MITIELDAQLREVDHPGEYYTSGVITTPLPSLVVAGVGHISFPLPPAQAQQIIDIAERAPYGRGPETLVDTRIRRAWQLSPDQLQLSGAPWTETVETITCRTAADLGVAGGVFAELYKLVLYEPAGFFLEHRDSEKTSGMFGTLVIVLPSPYSGGELIVRHADQETIIALAGDIPSEVSYAAFYSDCRHELRPVTAGVRLALVYNLIRSDIGAPPAPPDHRVASRQLTRLLTQWRQRLMTGNPAEDVPEKVIYLLSHHYTAAELSFRGLKNKDAAAAHALTPAADAAECALHLAMVSIAESGSAESTWVDYRRRRYRGWEDDEDDADFEVIEVHEREEHLTEWRAPDDAVIGLGRLPFDERELSPPGSLKDQEPDEKSYMEASGNEGASFERSWRRAALVIWPKSQTLALVHRAGLDASVPYLGQLTRRWLAEGADPTSQLWEDACALAQEMIDDWEEGSWSWREPSLPNRRAMTLSLLNQLGEQGLIVQMISRVLVNGVYDGSENEALTATLPLLSPSVGRVLLRQLVASHAQLQFRSCAELLAMASVRSRGVDPQILQEATVVLVETLPGGTDGGNASLRWRRPSQPDSLFVYSLMVAVWQLKGSARLSTQACAHLLKYPESYPIDGVLLPAVLGLLENPEPPSHAVIGPLESACLTHLRGRIALPLEPPADWRRDASAGCGCADCAALQTFLRDPTARDWRYPINKQRRKHLYRQAERHQWDVDLETERVGRPFTMKGTKNQKSYHRRVVQRGEDVAALARLTAARSSLRSTE